MPKSALGRGLGALIPELPTTRQPEGFQVREIETRVILPNRYQPRKHFDEERMKELVASIREKGVLQPVLVQRGEEGGYTLIAGERRWRAARLAGLERIPAVVREVTAEEMLELALVENLQREDLNPVEAARAYQRLMKEFGLTQEEVAQRVGKPRATVANFLRLLSLPKEIQQDLAQGLLTLGHAKGILGLSKKADQLRLRDRIVKQALSVREAETAARRIQQPPARREARSLPPHLSDLQDRMQEALGTRVRIHPGRRGGRVEIVYYSEEDLSRIVEGLGI